MIRFYDLRSYLRPTILRKIPILTTLGITLPGVRVSFIHPVKYDQILNLELLAIIVVRTISISK